MYIQIPDVLLHLAREPCCLNYGEIILLAHVTSLSKNGKCYITNKALAELLCTSERTIKRWISDLRDKKLIIIYYEELNMGERRIIEVSKVALDGAKIGT